MMLNEMNVAETHTKVRELLYPLIDEKVESFMTKTNDGLVFEIRTPLPGTPCIMDAVAITETYKSLKDFITLDGVREQLAGLAIQVGKLVEKYDAPKD